jgi:hypothetical protein
MSDRRRVYVPKYEASATVLGEDDTHYTLQVDGFLSTRVVAKSAVTDSAPVQEHPRKPFAGGFHGRRTR